MNHQENCPLWLHMNGRWSSTAEARCTCTYQPPEGVCNHNYIYSHKDQVADSGMIYRAIDVVVCNKCGDVKRN